MLLATSYIEALHQRFPSANIDFFVQQPFNEVVEGHPFIHEVISSRGKKRSLIYFFSRFAALLKIIIGHYDLVIDQQGNAGSATVMMVCFARYRLGWSTTRGGRYFCNLKAVPGPGRYHGNRNFDILTPLGISEQPYRLHVTIKNDSFIYIGKWLDDHHITRKRFICIATQSTKSANQWSSANFLALFTLLASETALPAVLTFAPAEEGPVRSLHEAANGHAVIGPPTNYNQIAALISECTLLICPEGGLNHLSVATGTPTIALFGKPVTASWSPEGFFPHHYHIFHPHEPGDSSLRITPEEVLSKVHKLLSETGYSA